MKTLLEAIKQAGLACNQENRIDEETIEHFKMFQIQMETKIIYQMIDEGVLSWSGGQEKVKDRTDLYSILQEEAEKLFKKYGYSAKSFYRILFKKSVGKFPEQLCRHVYYPYGELKIWILQ